MFLYSQFVFPSWNPAQPEISDLVVQHEVFGPVLTLQTFADEADAIRLANSTEYGLAAQIWTGSEDRAERVGGALRAGTVWVNCFLIRDLTDRKSVV